MSKDQFSTDKLADSNSFIRISSHMPDFYKNLDYCWHFVLTYSYWDCIVKKSEYSLMRELLTRKKSDVTIDDVLTVQYLTRIINDYCETNSLYSLTQKNY